MTCDMNTKSFSYISMIILQSFLPSNRFTPLFGFCAKFQQIIITLKNIYQISKSVVSQAQGVTCGLCCGSCCGLDCGSCCGYCCGSHRNILYSRCGQSRCGCGAVAVAVADAVAVAVEKSNRSPVSGGRDPLPTFYNRFLGCENLPRKLEKNGVNRFTS